MAWYNDFLDYALPIAGIAVNAIPGLGQLASAGIMAGLTGAGMANQKGKQDNAIIAAQDELRKKEAERRAMAGINMGNTSTTVDYSSYGSKGGGFSYRQPSQNSFLNDYYGNM